MEAINSEDVQLQDKYARRAEFARLKKMFSWANPNDLQKLAMGTGSIETLYLGSDKTHLRHLETLIQKCGWQSRMQKFEKILKERKQALMASSTSILPMSTELAAQVNQSNQTPPLSSEEVDYDSDEEGIVSISLEITQLPATQIEIGYAVYAVLCER